MPIISLKLLLYLVHWPLKATIQLLKSSSSVPLSGKHLGRHGKLYGSLGTALESWEHKEMGELKQDSPAFLHFFYRISHSPSL